MRSKAQEDVVIPIFALANVIIFLLAGISTITDWSLSPARLSDALISMHLPTMLKELATLFTYSFFHANFDHIFGNMLMLIVLGRLVERELGNARFAACYFLSAFGGSLAFYLIAPAAMSLLLGASGAVAGIMGAYLVLISSGRTRIDFFSLLGAAVIVYWLYGQVVSSYESAIGTRTDAVAYVTHLAGFACGAWLTWRMGKTVKKAS